MPNKGPKDLHHLTFSVFISYCFLSPPLQHTRTHTHSSPSTLVVFILRDTRLCTGCSLGLEFISYRFLYDSFPHFFHGFFKTLHYSEAFPVHSIYDCKCKPPFTSPSSIPAFYFLHRLYYHGSFYFSY